MINKIPNIEQLLWVSQLSSGTGYEIFSAVYNNLYNWCLLDKIEVMVFDTTVSNSGRVNNTYVLLE